MTQTVTDLQLIEMGLNRSEWQVIKNLARHGDEDQRDTLCAWAYRSVPGIMYEEIATLCGRDYLLDWTIMTLSNAQKLRLEEEYYIDLAVYNSRAIDQTLSQEERQEARDQFTQTQLKLAALWST